jgi:hypothetical protein
MNKARSLAARTWEEGLKVDETLCYDISLTRRYPVMASRTTRSGIKISRQKNRNRGSGTWLFLWRLTVLSASPSQYSSQRALSWHYLYRWLMRRRYPIKYDCHVPSMCGSCVHHLRSALLISTTTTSPSKLQVPLVDDRTRTSVATGTVSCAQSLRSSSHKKVCKARYVGPWSLYTALFLSSQECR